jgi:hypothetical protein
MNKFKHIRRVLNVAFQCTVFFIKIAFFQSSLWEVTIYHIDIEDSLANTPHFVCSAAAENPSQAFRSK